MIKQNRSLLSLINQEKQLHPQARLHDYYKLIFQAIYGPGHIIDNRESAYYYLKQELEQNDSFDEINIQDISWTAFIPDCGCKISITPQDYCRVSLKLIKVNYISLKEYLDLFLKSADNQIKYDKNHWCKIWDSISIILKELMIDNYATDLELISNNLLINKPIARHSEIYRKTYQPHYRLIRKKLLYTSDIFTPDNLMQL